MGSHIYSKAVKNAGVSKDLEKKMREYIRNEMRKRMKQYENNLNMVNKELFEGGVISWFNNQVRSGLSRNGMNTILNSYSIESDRPTMVDRKDGNITIHLRSRFILDSSVYEQNMNSLNVRWFNKWSNKYNKGYDAGDFILGLQTDYGIYGLPEEWEHPNYRMGGITKNPYYSEGVPLMQYLIGSYKNHTGNSAGGTTAGHYSRMYKKMIKKIF